MPSGTCSRAQRPMVPASGVQLRPERRPGYDLTFSAPKGVSLLWAFGSDDVRDTISAAHDRAVGAVLDHLSAEACFARRGRDGKQLIEANGFIGAAFRHRTSRAGDPQLHTHVVVPNLVQGVDGQWSAPDGRHLYAWKKTAGTLYQSALRAELAPLGLAWDIRRNGLSELRDIPKTILRAFSKRRVDIEAAMEHRGCTSSEGSRDRRPRHPGTQACWRHHGRRAARRLGGATRRRSNSPTARAARARPASTT